MMVRAIVILLLLFISSCKSSNLITYNSNGKVYGEKYIVLNVDEIYAKLLQLSPELNRTKPVAIHYFPINDNCNSSGTKDKFRIREFFKPLEIKANKIRGTQVLYLFQKYDKYLERYRGVLDLKKDSDLFIYNTFFSNKGIYCSGFVLISPNGNYISHYSEYSQDYFINRLEQLPSKKYKM